MISRATLIAAFLLSAVCRLSAVTITWSGTTDGDFSKGTNWVGGTVPTSDGTNTALVFSSTSNATLTVSGLFDANSITFSSTASNYVFGGNNSASLGIGSGGVTANSSTGSIASSATLPIRLLASQTWSTPGNLTVSGNVSGAFALTIGGGGSVTLSGTNTYSGGTSVTNGTNLFFPTNASIPASGSVTSSDKSNYVGVGQDGGMTQLLARIASPSTFKGTLGFDTDPAAASPTIFHDAINFSSFTNASFAGLGTFSRATYSGSLTTTTNQDYLFGGGGGTLYVTSNLTRTGLTHNGSGGVTLISPGKDESQHLKVVLQGANTFTGAVDVTISSVVFDSPSALPSGVNFTLHDDAYAGFTENATGFTDFASFKSRLTSGFDADAIVGIDSSTTAGRSVSYDVNLTGSDIFLGTATKITLSGNITAPTSGTLFLTGVNGGYLKIASPLTPGGNVTKVNVGFSENETGVADNDVTYHGIVELTGASTYTGNTTLDSGYLLIGASSTGNVTSGPLGKGSLVVEADADAPVLAASANVTLANNINLTNPGVQIGIPATTNSTDLAYSLQSLRGNNLTLTGVVSGNGSIDYEGAGTLTLSGNNTYSGSLTINSGTVQFAKPASLPSVSASKLIVASGATAAFNVGGTGEFASGNITTIAATGNATGGFQSGSSLGLDTTNAAGGNFTYSGIIANPNGGANSLGLAKLGTGTLNLTGGSTFTGNVTIRAGTLRIGVANALPTAAQISLASGSTLEVANDQTIAGFFGASGSGASILLGATGNLTVAMPVANTITSFAGNVSGNGVFSVSGAGGDVVNLTGNVTNTGGTVVGTGASLILASGGLGSGPITANGTLAFGNPGIQTLTNPIGGTGSILQSAGTTTLSAPSTYSGGTAITGGKLIVSNSIGSATGTGPVVVSGGGILGGSGIISGSLVLNSGGTVSPGNSPGILTVGPTVFAGGGNFAFDLNSATGIAGANWDLLSISAGALTITANSGNPFTISLTSLDILNNAGLAQNFNPAQSYSWQFVSTTGGITGFAANAFNFNTSQFQNSLGTGSFFVSQSGNSLFVNFTPVPEPSTWVLLASGVATLAVAARRRRSR